MERAYSIADDYDPDGDMAAGADPLTEYLTYLSHVHEGAVGDMGFTLDDFKRYRRVAEMTGGARAEPKRARIARRGRHGLERLPHAPTLSAKWLMLLNLAPPAHIKKISLGFPNDSLLITERRTNDFNRGEY